MLDKKPKMVKNLKIIEYIGSLYATTDGEKIWEIDRVVYEVLKLCDGKRTVEEIAEELAREAEVKKEDIIPLITDMIKELEKRNFIEYV